MKKIAMPWWTAGVLCAGLLSVSAEQAEPDIYPTAILPFNERGAGAQGYGAMVGDMLFAQLVAHPDLFLVDRAEIDRTLQEQELSLTGMVDPAEAVRVGHLIGAKVLITGSVIHADRDLYLVARIIGTETSRVLGASVRGQADDALSDLAEELAAHVADTLVTRSTDLIPKTRPPVDRIAAINEALGERERPALMIRIAERHVGRASIDPAAETELTLIARETGFEVVNPAGGTRPQADIVIEGEGFSEFAMRRGNLVSVKARLELKAVDRATERIIATDRETTVIVDLTEQLAGKSALQEAAARIAERMLPKLVE